MSYYPPPPPVGAPTPAPQPAQPQYQTVVSVPTTNGTAVASLVISILSWFLCPIVGALVAVFLGLSARSDIARNQQAGRGMATAGIIIGAAHFLIYGAILLVIMLVAFGACAAVTSVGTGG